MLQNDLQKRQVLNTQLVGLANSLDSYDTHAGTIYRGYKLIELVHEHFNELLRFYCFHIHLESTDNSAVVAR